MSLTCVSALWRGKSHVVSGGCWRWISFRQRADGGGSRKIHRKASRLWPSRKQGSVLDWRKNPLESILVSDGQAIPPRCASHALLLTGRVNALGVVEWKTGVEPASKPTHQLSFASAKFNQSRQGSKKLVGEVPTCFRLVKAANPAISRRARGYRAYRAYRGYRGYRGRERVSRVTRVSGRGRGSAGAPHGIPGNTGIQGIQGIAGNTGIATAAGKENDAPGLPVRRSRVLGRWVKNLGQASIRSPHSCS